ncbi:hypothetical protein ACVWXM_004809 [Bradyrhizobium sp. GM7.3]
MPRAATRSSSAWALAGGQERSWIWPGTKITVLPATENWPLPPLHQSSSTTSPLSPISMFGIRFEPGCGSASSVISVPNGKPSSARASVDIASVATAAHTICLNETMRPLDRRDLRHLL